MSGLQITLIAIAAVLVFWAIGAYNRLVRLRGAIVRAFVPVAQQLGQRHTLLQRQAELLAPLLPGHADTLTGLLAACAQAQAARAHASAHPGAPGALNSLRLAEDILLETRAKLPMPGDASAEQAELNARLAEVETALQFARGRFNNGVAEYNRAVQQFPTWLLAGLFGFRAAGAF